MKSSPFSFLVYYLLGALIYFIFDGYAFRPLQQWVGNNTGSWAIGHIIAYLITMIPLGISSLLIHRFQYKNDPRLYRWFGLKNNVFHALLFGLACTSPMLIGFLFNFKVDRSLTTDYLIILTISSAFFEEVIFRGYLFGMLYRNTKWGFFPSVLLGSVIFGLIHLYQAKDLLESTGIFLITFLGSLLFSWVYAEWKLNLWFAIFLHFFMNLNWSVFAVDDNGLGGVLANFFRFGTLALAVMVTLWWNKKQYGKWSLVFQKSDVT
jgi:membrane protease YdiL (CAAX protease family)